MHRRRGFELIGEGRGVESLFISERMQLGHASGAKEGGFVLGRFEHFLRRFRANVAAMPA